jgi:hypothetical protein
MSLPLIIFLLTLLISIPLSGMLLYVWWKYGNNEKGVKIARIVFLVGLFGLLGYMIAI